MFFISANSLSKLIHNNKLYKNTDKYVVDSRSYADQIITNVDDMKFHRY